MERFSIVLLALLVVNLTNHCALGKVVTNFVGRENLEEEGLSQLKENAGMKLYNDLYNYYDEAFEEYAGQRVVDLDQEFEEYGGQQVVDLDEYENELGGKSSPNFVTEDDVEENYHNNYEKSSRSNGHALTSPAMQFDLKCPDLPFYPVEGKRSLCLAKTCQSDSDCVDENVGSIRGYACCFNGCVLACLPKNDPPKAFDWVVDTDAEQDQDGLNNLRITDKLKSLIPIYDQEVDASEKIRLPGGCVITLQQMEELKMFRKYDHVEVCTCKNEEVVCQIKARTSP